MATGLRVTAAETTHAPGPAVKSNHLPPREGRPLLQQTPRTHPSTNSFCCEGGRWEETMGPMERNHFTNGLFCPLLRTNEMP